MELADLPVRDVRRLLDEERADLLALLRSLSGAEWLAPTEAGAWRVRDVALHVLDDDLGWLSRGRDGDRSGLLDSSGDRRAFVAALDAKNERWAVGAAGLSRRVVTDLLEWTGAEVATYHATLDLTARSRVFWAGPGVVPLWFDLARDLTERWVHQRHFPDAVGRPGRHHRSLPEVLGTFVWAFPHQYRADAPLGTVVHLDLRPAGSWTLTAGPTGWVLGEGPAEAPTPCCAWRPRWRGVSSPASRWTGRAGSSRDRPGCPTRSST